MLNLQLNDYVNLLKLIDGDAPLWTDESRQRCIKAGLISGTGRFLTQEGERKARVLQGYVRKLEAGLPLTSRVGDRIPDLEKEQWKQTQFKDQWCFFNSRAMFKGRTPDPLWRTAPKVDINDFQHVKNELYGYLASDPNNYRKAIPYAVQIDQLGHHEYICLKSIFKNDYFRIRSPYYDYCIATYPKVTFWFRLTGGDVMVVKAGNNTTGFQDGIVAFVKLCYLDRSFPPFSSPVS